MTSLAIASEAATQHRSGVNVLCRRPEKTVQECCVPKTSPRCGTFNDFNIQNQILSSWTYYAVSLRRRASTPVTKVTATTATTSSTTTSPPYDVIRVKTTANNLPAPRQGGDREARNLTSAWAGGRTGDLLACQPASQSVSQSGRQASKRVQVVVSGFVAQNSKRFCSGNPLGCRLSS